MAAVNSSLLADADTIARGARQMRAVCLGVPRTRAIRVRLELQRMAREAGLHVDDANVSRILDMGGREIVRFTQFVRDAMAGVK